MAQPIRYLFIFSSVLCGLLAAQQVVFDSGLTPIFQAISNDASAKPFETVSSANTTVYVNQFGFPFTPSAFTPSPAVNATAPLSAQYVSVPLAVSSICIAADPKGEVNTSVALTASLLSDLILGRNPISFSTLLVTNSAFNTVKVMLSKSTLPALVSSMRTHSAATFPSASSLPLNATLNPLLSVFDDDTAAIEAIQRTNGIALVSLVAAVRARMACLPLTIRPSGFPVTTVRPELLPEWQSVITVNVAALTATCPTSSICYPLVGVVTGHFRRSSTDNSCSTNATIPSFLKEALATSSQTAASVVQWNMLLLTAAVRVSVLNLLTNLTCTGSRIIPSAGGVTPQSAFLDWFDTYFFESNATVFVRYAGTSAGDGLAAMKNRATVFAGATALVEADRIAFPTLRSIPVLGSSVSVVFNLGGPRTLIIPRCLVAAIFNGTITYWNDTRLQDANPMTTLPPNPIEVVFRSEPAATTEVFMAGLRLLDAQCFGATAIPPEALLPNIQYNNTRITGNAGVANYVARTPFSVTWVGSDLAIRTGALQASLLGPDGGTSSPAPINVAAAIARSSLNTTTSDVSFAKIGLSSYPFIGVFSYIIETETTSINTTCADIKAAMDYLQWTLTSVKALSLLTADLFTPLPESFRAHSVDIIRSQVKCDGMLLYPKPPQLQQNSNDTTVAIIVSVLVVLIAAVMAVFLLLRPSGRENKHAPKDSSEPVAFAFTDVESSTGLWAFEPQAMSQALEDHHRIIRSALAKHKCYEVKTVGDCFMVASSSPQSLLNCMLEVQLELQAHTWDQKINDAYQTIEEDREEEALQRQVFTLTASNNTAKGQFSRKDRTVWNGLRVRVGLHVGMVDVVLDEITKGYDYYGPAVNVAARIEAASHGGQICVSQAFLSRIQRDDTVFTVLPLGAVPLRGVPEPTELTQVLPLSLAKRVFPPLRLDTDDALQEEEAGPEVWSKEDSQSVVSTTQNSEKNHTEQTITSALRILLMSCDASFRTDALDRFCKRLGLQSNQGGDAAVISRLARRLAGMTRADMRRGGAKSAIDVMSNGSTVRSVRATPADTHLEKKGVMGTSYRYSPSDLSEDPHGSAP